ncbi:MAG: ROK family protein [Phycisphaerales bacterium]|nr:ROK family protein [Phycisphaerales bacterium]
MATKNGGTVIGIDLGGTNMQIGVVDAEGRIIGRAKRKTKAELGLDGVVDRLVEGVQRACDDAALALDSIAAVGIGVPGAIDVPNGVVLEAPNLGWFDTPIRKILTDRLGRPVVVDNDVNVAVWGEYVRGAVKGGGDTLGVWVGTGVGGGLVIDGKLYHGTRFTAGEIGQTWILPGGGPVARILEHHSSRTAIVDAIDRALSQYPDSIMHGVLKENKGKLGSSDVAAAFREHDPLVIEVVEHAARLLGVAIANAVTLLSLQSVVLGGGMTEALGDEFVALVKQSFNRAVFPAKLSDCRMVATELMDTAGVQGAALLAGDAA